MELERQFKKLITKQAKYESTNLGLNLLISRLQRHYAANQSPEELNKCCQEMKTFFDKYASVLGKDIEALKRL